MTEIFLLFGEDDCECADLLGGFYTRHEAVDFVERAEKVKMAEDGEGRAYTYPLWARLKLRTCRVLASPPLSYDLKELSEDVREEILWEWENS